MSLTFAEQFLVVVLAAALAVFLTLGIIALVKINKILKDVKHVTERAGQIADQAEHISEFFHKTAGPAAAAKFVTNLISTLKSKKDKKDKKDKKE